MLLQLVLTVFYFFYLLNYRCVTIFSLAFSMDGIFLSASSNTETVHIFKLETVKEKYVFILSVQLLLRFSLNAERV